MTTWILVGDAGRVRIFSNQQQSKAWQVEHELSEPRARARVNNILSDQQGRSGSGRNAASRSGVSSRTSPKDTVATRFAHEVVGYLQQGRTTNRFDELVLVAPPTFLGRVRHDLDAPLRKTIIKTIAKDLSNEESTKIPTLLQGAW